MAENGSKQFVLSKRRLPVVVELANVPQREMRWLWPGKIPLGKLTLLAGDPELGKSFLTIDMAARVTRRPTRDVPHLLKGGREVARQRAMAAVPPTTSPRGSFVQKYWDDLEVRLQHQIARDPLFASIQTNQGKWPESLIPSHHTRSVRKRSPRGDVSGN